MGGVWQHPTEEKHLKRKNLLNKDSFNQVTGAVSDLYRNYRTMKSHDVISDDYYHCKANYQATKRGTWGESAAELLGNEKETFDYFKNRLTGSSFQKVRKDYWNDIGVNEEGRKRARSGNYSSAEEACRDYLKEDSYQLLKQRGKL